MIDTVQEFLSNSTEFYFYVAVASTLFFIIQFCFAVFGGGDHGDVHLHLDHDVDLNHDFDHGSASSTTTAEISGTDYSGIADINLFSLKSITAFVMFFGWAGFFWGNKGFIGLAIAIACGLVMMFLTALVIWLLMRMQQSGNINSSDIVGNIASVYLKIPAGRTATGKIIVALDNCSRELKAVADEEINRGAQVLIKAHVQGTCYLVEKYSTPQDEK